MCIRDRYTGVDGTRMDGISVLDADTVAGGPPRLIGDVVICLLYTSDAADERLV